MFTQLFNKFSTLATHHQIISAGVAALSFIILNWSIEKLLEKYLFPGRPTIGYFLAIVGSLIMLIVIQHFILHVF